MNSQAVYFNAINCSIRSLNIAKILKMGGEKLRESWYLAKCLAADV